MSLVRKTDENGKFPKPKKRTLSDAISRLREKSDKKFPESLRHSCDVTSGMRWYLVSGEGRVVMTTDAEVVKKVCDVFFELIEKSSSYLFLK